MSNSKLNKLKLRISNCTEVTLKLSSNVAVDSNDENSFSHKLLWTITQVLRLRKSFANNSSANIKLSKSQLHKIRQSGGFLGRLLGPLLKTELLLIGNVLKLLVKSVLIPLELTAAASVTDAAIHKNEQINDIIKIIKPPEESGLLIKGVKETIKNETKKQKIGFLRMSLGTLGARILENLLAGKCKIRAGKDTIRTHKGTIRAIKTLLGQAKIFNAALSFNNVSNTKVLSK